MRLFLQRVRQASVSCEGREVSRIGHGLLVFAGFGQADVLQDTAGGELGLPATKYWDAMLKKCVSLRIFPDDAGKMNLDVAQAGGELLVVSQFTLYAGLTSGRRPSFSNAAPPQVAKALYEALLEDFAARLPGEMPGDSLGRVPGQVKGGVFGGDMDVALVNWGPVTMLLDSVEFGGP